MEFLLFDGAMGTQLHRKGLAAGELPEIFNLTHPDAVLEIHRSYVAAGADVVTTNTFQANAIKLASSGHSVEEIVNAGVNIAKKAGARYVALDLGPSPRLIEPLGDLSFEDVYEMYKQQVVAGHSGADIILIETLSSLHEAKAAILAAKEHCDLPVYVTLTFQADGHTFLGTDPETVVIALQGLGIDAIGVNCSLGPQELMPIVERMLKYARVPVMVQPNAGLPQVRDGKTVYTITPDEFGKYIEAFAKRGAMIFGGCCGTSPEYIANIRQRLNKLTPIAVEPTVVTAASSATKLVVFDNKLTVIGQRINPTGNKDLAHALINNELDYIVEEAMEQAAEADVLDVNAGLAEMDEPALLTSMVREINGLVSLPLQIDSSSPIALEAAARVYNGKPIINSVTGAASSMAEVFPVVRKYGAAVIGLTLDEHGIPQTAHGRLEIARKLLDTAQTYGISREDLLIDCLVLPAATDPAMAMAAIDACRLVKSELGLKTVLGISNISFGMPARELLNSTFLATALGAGLDAAILDPRSQVIQTVRAFQVLNGNDKNAAGFIAKFS